MTDPSSDSKLTAHLFICTNQKPKGECCGAKGAEDLRKQVKELTKQLPEFKNCKIRINASGCLGQCEHGISSVLYPGEGEWTLRLKSDSHEQLLQKLRQFLHIS